MKIASYKIKKYSRKFVEPFVTSKGTHTHREGVIISIKTAEGNIGYGEAAPLPDYSSTGLTSIEKMLNEIMRQLPGVEIPNDLPSISGYIAQICNSNSICRFALESTLCDAASREKELPLNKWLNPDAQSRVPVNYLIGKEIENWDEMATEIKEGGYQAVKIKVGGDPYKDIDRVKKIRGDLKSDIAIRLDANQGWTYNQALYVLNQLRNENIDHVEEPIGNPDADKIRTLGEETDCPIALDESLFSVFDPRNAIREKICDVIILKASQIGSFAGILDLCNLARLYNRRIVLTSTLESEIGIAAQLHLASLLGENIPPCGFDTLRLFENADPDLSRVQDGYINLSSGNGIGYVGTD
ncbi:MAG: o-succinylbenzoate synthase [candidate division Zixibacteria bacterium]